MRHVCVHYRCTISSNTCWMMCRMTGRNDCVIAYALESVAQALHGQQNHASDEFRGLGKFQRNNPMTFKGR